MKANYHYEWFLYTDNLCDGRMLLTHGSKIDCLMRRMSYHGATTIEKHRVCNK